MQHSLPKLSSSPRGSHRESHPSPLRAVSAGPRSWDLLVLLWPFMKSFTTSVSLYKVVILRFQTSQIYYFLSRHEELAWNKYSYEETLFMWCLRICRLTEFELLTDNDA